MARIAGVDLPRDKRVVVGLTYIYGIGRSRSPGDSSGDGRGSRHEGAGLDGGGGQPSAGLHRRKLRG